MKRREALISILGAASAAAVPSGLEAQALTAESAGGLLSALCGLEPMPGESEAMLGFLMSMRSTARPDPGIQPAVTFDPEADP